MWCVPRFFFSVLNFGSKIMFMEVFVVFAFLFKGSDTVTKHKELSLSSLTDKQEESDLDLTSPGTYV